MIKKMKINSTYELYLNLMIFIDTFLIINQFYRKHNTYTVFLFMKICY